MKNNFEVYFLEDARKFLASLSKEAQQKILYNIDKAKITKDPKLFKKLTSTIWEFRTQYNSIQYRLFAFWDTGKNAIVIATHGVVKKTDKVPKNDIAKAEALKKQYLENNEK